MRQSNSEMMEAYGQDGGIASSRKSGDLSCKQRKIETPIWRNNHIQSTDKNASDSKASASFEIEQNLVYQDEKDIVSSYTGGNPTQQSAKSSLYDYNFLAVTKSNEKADFESSANVSKKSDPKLVNTRSSGHLESTNSHLPPTNSTAKVSSMKNAFKPPIARQVINQEIESSGKINFD